MLSFFALLSLLPFITASPLTARAEGLLTLSVSPSSTPTEFQTTLTNTGTESITLLKDPRGALNSFPAETFKIEHESGGVPAFVGAKVKYVPQTVVSKNITSAMTTLAPGQSIHITHDLTQSYDFTKTGTGKYTYTPSNLFFHATSGLASPIYAVHTPHTATLSKLPSKPASKHMSKRANYVGCSDDYQSQLVSAASAAQSYASSTNSYTSSISGSTDRFDTWFGSYTDDHHSTIASHFGNLNGNDYSSYTYDCSTCTDAGTYAYVYPDSFGEVYLCPVFWQSPTTGTDSQGGTLIHESSHFTRNAGTQDYAYGQSAAKSLAQSDSDKAVFNADSHEYYAENNPQQS